VYVEFVQGGHRSARERESPGGAAEEVPNRLTEPRGRPDCVSFHAPDRVRLGTHPRSRGIRQSGDREAPDPGVRGHY
jgi:hypothetical protein